MKSESVDCGMNAETCTTDGIPAFSITAGGLGYRGLPLMMALGQFVTTGTPPLVEAPPPVLEHAFTGGSIGFPSRPLERYDYQLDREDASQKIARAELFFSAHLAELRAKYQGRFVAIYNSRVIDTDTNLDRLMGRVYKVYGYRPILMRRVQEQADRLARAPLPRRSKAGQDAVQLGAV